VDRSNEGTQDSDARTPFPKVTSISLPPYMLSEYSDEDLSPNYDEGSSGSDWLGTLEGQDFENGEAWESEDDD
jgi:hypothetical protein